MIIYVVGNGARVCRCVRELEDCFSALPVPLLKCLYSRCFLLAIRCDAVLMCLQEYEKNAHKSKFLIIINLISLVLRMRIIFPLVFMCLFSSKLKFTFNKPEVFQCKSVAVMDKVGFRGKMETRRLLA